LLRIGYAYKWTGFGQSSVNENIEPAKTLWDWLDLLIVSAVLAVLGLWFNRAQRGRDEYLQSQRAEDDALEKYLDYVSKLLVDNHKALGSDISAPAWSETSKHPVQYNEDEVVLRETLSTVLRARTLAVLARLQEPYRKTSIVAFLYESGLIVKSSEDSSGSFVALGGADLSGIDLSGSGAHLDYINLAQAYLPGAVFAGASLIGADLSSADLSSADLSGANLPKVSLFDTNLSDADLTNAIGVTSEELNLNVSSLEGATMPTGQKYEDWLKDKNRQTND
jgi:hypothetical protein